MIRLAKLLTLVATFLFAVCTFAQSQLTANTLRLDTPDKAARVALEHFNFMAGSCQGTSYRVPEPDRLEVYLALRRGGETQEVSFTFDRVSR